MKPGPEWRSYWLCIRRSIAAETNADLASPTGLYLAEQHCATEKADYLLAQLDGVPRRAQAQVASNVDLVCGIEATLDTMFVQVYRGAGKLTSGAPSGWDDPADPMNQDGRR